MAKSLLFELVGRTRVVVQNNEPIDDREWDARCATNAVPDWDGMVIWAEKVMPNPSQRLRIRKALDQRGLPFRAGLLTNSAMARTVIGIFSVFVGDQLKGFSQNDVDGAVQWARVPAEQRAAVVAALHRMRASLGV